MPANFRQATPFLWAACLFLSLPAYAQATFDSPSGNIICYPTETTAVTCIIFENDWSESQQGGLAFEDEEECGLDLTPVFELPVQGPPNIFMSCHGDAFWPTENRFVLPYGYSLHGPGFRCASEKAGMNCRNRQGHGFAIARARYRILTPPVAE